MKRFVLISISLIMAVNAFVSAQTTRYVCQDCDPQVYQPQYTTISAAISAAQNGDTINIWGEEDELNEGYIYEYQEHLVINKTLTLTCENPDPDLGYPIITQSFSGVDPPEEIISIVSGGDGSVIQYLNVRGPASGLITDCTGDPMVSWMDWVGIRITAHSCQIIDCRVTRCMTGICVMTEGNLVKGCTIGDRWIQNYNNTWTTEEYFSLDHNFPSWQAIDHPGNGFGIVLHEPSWVAPSSGYESRSPNEIVDSTIRSNRYWGVVLTNGSRAQVAHNIIAWNGDYGVNQAWTSIPDKSGGLLCLFTANQLNSNDNQLQSPVIRSNNIYGNKGYQIGVFTESDDCTTIYNSPVIMSNNIGVEEGMPPLLIPDNYDFLVCAGPTPDSTPGTPVPCEPDYEFFGSGPLFAWNNYHDPTEDHQRRMYHPGGRNRWPGPVPPTSTETPIPTITPTPTITSTFTPGFPPTITPMPPSSMPTGMPTASAPTPTPAPPVPGFYKMDDKNWEVLGLKENPQFVGWTTPTPGMPPEYDWHLRDFSDEPSRTPSLCYNQGGIDLNPGSTRDDGMRDTGFVDLGRHIKDPVPLIENIQIVAHPGKLRKLMWDIPEYYPDGSRFYWYEVGGHIVFWGQLDVFNPNYHVDPIGRPIYQDASTTEFIYDPENTPSGATHLGVIIYTVRWIESDIVWIELPD